MEESGRVWIDDNGQLIPATYWPALLASLKEVKSVIVRAIEEEDESTLYAACGICGEVQQSFFSGLHSGKVAVFVGHLREIMAQWPKFSGDLMYPVPCPEGFDPEHTFEAYDTDLWGNHEYGRLRMELLDFVISYAEERVKEFKSDLKLMPKEAKS